MRGFYFSLFFLFLNVSVSAATLSALVEQAFLQSKELELAGFSRKIERTKQGEAAAHFLPKLTTNWQMGSQKNAVQGEDPRSKTQQNTKTLSLEQTVFNGFESIHHVRSAGYSVKAADSRFEATKSQFAYSVIDAYVSLAIARKIYYYRKKNLSYAKKIMRKVSERQYLQVISKNEVAQYEMAAHRSRSELLDAQKALYDAEARFSLFFDIMPKRLKLPRLFIKRFNKDLYVQSLDRHNPELQTAFFEYKAAVSDFGRTKSAFLPKAKLVGSYRKQENLVYLDDKDLNTTQVYVDISYPLYDSGQRFVRNKKARNTYLRYQKQYELQKETLLKDLEQSLKSYAASRQLLRSSRSLTDALGKRVTALKQELKLGTSDILALWMARQEYYNALSQQLDLHKQEYLMYYKILQLSAVQSFWKPKASVAMAKETINES